MLYVEDKNESRRFKIGSFLHFKIGKPLLPRFRTKTSVALLAIASLAAAPGAALAVHGLAEPNFATGPIPSPLSINGAASTTTSQATSATTQLPAVGSGNSQNQGTTSTQVTIDGQTVPVSENGSVHKTVTTQNGQTTVDVSNSSTGTSNSSSIVNVYSSSYSSNTAGGSHVSN